MEKVSKNCMSLLVSNTEATISYISAFFPTPYADNKLLCSLCGSKPSHIQNNNQV